MVAITTPLEKVIELPYKVARSKYGGLVYVNFFGVTSLISGDPISNFFVPVAAVYDLGAVAGLAYEHFKPF